MNTSELIKQLSHKLNITQVEARRLLHQELEAISQHLHEGKNVVVRGFGTFGIRQTKNPKTQQTGQTVFFRASQKFKDFIKPWRPS